MSTRVTEYLDELRPGDRITFPRGDRVTVHKTVKLRDGRVILKFAEPYADILVAWPADALSDLGISLGWGEHTEPQTLGDLVRKTA